MSDKSWDSYTVEFLREAAGDAIANGFPPWGEMLHAFADMKEAEQRQERCVLPAGVAGRGKDLHCLYGARGWFAFNPGVITPTGMGKTPEKAIENFALKLRGTT